MQKLIALLFVLTMSLAAPAGAVEPKMDHYTAEPPQLVNVRFPAVLLVMAKDYKMFLQAYSDTDDVTGDGHMDIGFNPSVTYVGYFDSHSCYRYAGSRFERTGPAVVPPQNYDPRPASLKLGDKVKKPGQPTIAVCGSHNPNYTGGGRWSGNWLNWMVSSRMDVIKKVLYGGTRKTDTAAQTVLEHTRVMNNAQTWGREVWSDATWEKRAGASPYYDITDFADVDKPSDSNSAEYAHFFIRSRDRLHVYTDLNTKSNNPEGLRIWELASPDSNRGTLPPNPVSVGFPSQPRSKKDFVLDVQVCKPIGSDPGDPKYIEAGDFCQAYGTTGFKPTGLLQKYGEGDTALFGLLTGIFSENYRFDAGVLRHNVASVANQIEANGVFKSTSLMKTMDKLAMTGPNSSSGWESPSKSIFGNPIGEMVYQGILYFSGASRWPSDSNIGGNPSEQISGLAKAGTWISPLQNPPSHMKDCLRPVLLLISDPLPSHDDDMVPGTPHAVRSGASGKMPTMNRPPLPNANYTNANLTAALNMEKYLAVVTEVEGYNQPGRKFYIANNTARKSNQIDDNVCTAKTISNLALARGICPGQPNGHGTYSAVAAAYYGNTRDIYDGHNVQTYAVAMSSPFPELSIKVKGKGEISFMPLAIATSGPNSGSGSTKAPSGTISTLALATYVIHWKTDSEGSPYSGAFFVNFDDQLEQGDFDRDAPVRYYFDLIMEHPQGKRLSRNELKNLLGSAKEGDLRDADAERNKEFVYRNWDYLKAPNYVLSTAGGSGTMTINIGGSNNSKGQGRPLQKYSYSYGEVVDIYGYIGDKGKYYKKIDRPEDIDKAVGISMFVYAYGAGSSNSHPTQAGYTISGVTDKNNDLVDGAYIVILTDSVHIPNGTGSNAGYRPVSHKYNVPPTCMKTGTKNGLVSRNYDHAQNDSSLKMADPFGINANVPGCGHPNLPFSSTRLFKFAGSDVKAGESLPDPLWLAAKYGGFIDANHNGLPDDPAEWDSDASGSPDTYFYAANMAKLKEALNEAFARIMGGMTTGTPTAATINSVMGGGLSIRTYYHSVFDKVPEQNNEVHWLGGVYAFFLDPWGNMREDSNGNGILDLATGADSARGDADGGDWIVNFSDGVDGPKLTLHRDIFGQGKPEAAGAITTTLERAKTLWDVARILADIPDDAISTPRGYNAASDPGRRIYFENPDITDKKYSLGSQPGGKKTLFSPDIVTDANYKQWFLTKTKNDADKLVKWVMGQDQEGLRSRQVYSPWVAGSTVKTWRLGDVINSTPVIVGTPFSGFDISQRDPSYADYKQDKSGRRNMAYFGANDGMLHAVNLGFTVPYSQGSAGYQAEEPLSLFEQRKKKDPGATRKAAHPLGKEMWAFVPKSVLPHLQWLANPAYVHSYYVDLKPMAVEIKDPSLYDSKWNSGELSTVGKDAWRTVLICTLRLGGRSIKLADGDYSYSEVFALDITDPETDPVFLWSFSHPNLGLPVAKPVVARYWSQNKFLPRSQGWAVAIPSGPTWDNFDGSTRNDGTYAYSGYSNQNARIFVVDAFTGQPATGYPNGYIDSGVPNSFFTDSFGVAPLRRGFTTAYVYNPTWNTMGAYLSLTQSIPSDGAAQVAPGVPSYIHQGGIWRLQMEDNGSALDPNSKWRLAEFFNAGRAVTGAVDATFDSRGQLWVFFGTGRLWHKGDFTPCSMLEGADLKDCTFNHLNYMYGIKEKQIWNNTPGGYGSISYEPADMTKIHDVTNVRVSTSGSLRTLNADGSSNNYYQPLEGPALTEYHSLANHFGSSKVSGWKRALTATMLDASGDDVDVVLNHGDMADPKANPATDWWKRISHEMNLHKPVLMAPGNGSSYLGFTTYEPSTDLCNGLGWSRLYMLDSFTGLPNPESANYVTSGGHWVKRGNNGSEITGRLSVANGMSSAAHVVYTGNSISLNTNLPGGGIQSITIPLSKTMAAGVVSWREIMDMTQIINDAGYDRDGDGKPDLED